MDFFQGDALNLRNRISRVLPHWDDKVPSYSYILGMHAFGLEECNQYPEAERTARRALDLQPRDGWAVHAVAHVMEMQGRIAEGIEWLQSRESDWAPDNMFAPHNWWHLALFNMDLGKFDVALDLFDQKLVGPQLDMMLVLLDASALLWRLRLEGVDVGNRFEHVADIWAGKLEQEAGYYAFNDAHAMMSFAATGRADEIARLRRSMRAAVKGNAFNAAMTRDVGMPLVDGLEAYARNRHAQSIAAIEPVRDPPICLGQSRAARFADATLIDASIRMGDTRRARHSSPSGQVHKPTEWSERLLARSERVSGESKRTAALSAALPSQRPSAGACCGNAVVTGGWRRACAVSAQSVLLALHEIFMLHFQK